MCNKKSEDCERSSAGGCWEFESVAAMFDGHELAGPAALHAVTKLLVF